MIRVLRVANLPHGRTRPTRTLLQEKFHGFPILVLLMCALGQIRSQRNEEEKALGNTTPPASFERVIKTPMLSSMRSGVANLRNVFSTNTPVGANLPAALDNGIMSLELFQMFTE
jgi:hypothetical protein